MISAAGLDVPKASEGGVSKTPSSSAYAIPVLRDKFDKPGREVTAAAFSEFKEVQLRLDFVS